jgi:prohibitin 2
MEHFVRKLGTFAITAVILLIGLYILAPFAIVSPGHRGVLTTLGSVSSTIYGEGIHFKWPLIQTMNQINVRIQKAEGESDAASRDMQQVHAVIALNYNIKPGSVVDVFRDIGQNIDEKVISPATHEMVKAVTANFTAEELISKRAIVSHEIKSRLVERLTPYGIHIAEVSIVNFAFSKSFNEAIEAKTTAEQLKLKADRDLFRIRVEAEQKVTSARAEAESLALQKQQVSAELIRLREVENQRRAIDKWNGVLPNVTGGAVPFINVNQQGK